MFFYKVQKKLHLCWVGSFFSIKHPHVPLHPRVPPRFYRTRVTKSRYNWLFGLFSTLFSHDDIWLKESDHTNPCMYFFLPVFGRTRYPWLPPRSRPEFLSSVSGLQGFLKPSKLNCMYLRDSFWASKPQYTPSWTRWACKLPGPGPPGNQTVLTIEPPCRPVVCINYENRKSSTCNKIQIFVMTGWNSDLDICPQLKQKHVKIKDILIPEVYTKSDYLKAQ